MAPEAVFSWSPESLPRFPRCTELVQTPAEDGEMADHGEGGGGRRRHILDERGKGFVREGRGYHPDGVYRGVYAANGLCRDVE